MASPKKPALDGTSFLPGMAVPRSGHYAVIHGNGHKPTRNVYFIEGLLFPHCPQCAVTCLRLSASDMYAESA